MDGSDSDDFVFQQLKKSTHSDPMSHSLDWMKAVNEGGELRKEAGGNTGDPDSQCRFYVQFIHC